MPKDTRRSLRHLIIVLGDQLDPNSAALDGFDPKSDAVWMAEVAEETTHVWSHKSRIAIFLAGMRHFRETIRNRGWTVRYRQLDDPKNLGSFSAEIRHIIQNKRPKKLVLLEPGEYRVKRAFQQTAQEHQIELEMRPDRHFLCSQEQFARHAEGRKQLRMEYFYREMRRKAGTLVENGQPTGGKWNYDAENRKAFGRAGPVAVPMPLSFSPDTITGNVLRLVDRQFASHPGRLETFDWPVTPAESQQALTDFITYRLPNFGKFQDALWTDEPFLYHSLLSPAMNLKLLDPRDVIDAAVAAFRSGRAPLSSVEGFVRQILGWREYVRGVYWKYMPEYLDRIFLMLTFRYQNFIGRPARI